LTYSLSANALPSRAYYISLLLGNIHIFVTGVYLHKYGRLA
jgi:hypothetical protein